MFSKKNSDITSLIKNLEKTRFDPLDFLPPGDLVEKMINLVIMGVPPVGPAKVTAALSDLEGALAQVDTSALNVVVFGGGTGLSNVIGGDSRIPLWPRSPFKGMKDTFPNTRSVVCVTDDGGSTGEFFKELPIIALGDLRHVLLSSIRRQNLLKQYSLSEEEAYLTAGNLHSLFNYRYSQRPASAEELIELSCVSPESMPHILRQALRDLLENIFLDERLNAQLDHRHCLGNLLLAAAIFKNLSPAEKNFDSAIIKGLRVLAEIIGAEPDSVLPCTTTPAQLKILYTNGVLVTGENKSAYAQRGYPVDRVFVEFDDTPHVPDEVMASIAQADIILFAPGSLFTSIIPILRVPGIARAIRANNKALKILVANLWIQKGETDIASDDPRRRFYVSDLVKAYHRNIPGGVHGLFHQVLTLRLQDIPGSVLQNYAVEGKVPIYLDNDRVREMGLTPFEARIFSQNALDERKVIQHDPESLATTVKTIWAARSYLSNGSAKNLPGCEDNEKLIINPGHETPNLRYAKIIHLLSGLDLDSEVRDSICRILWNHQDIPVSHLQNIRGVKLIDDDLWKRSQEWDNIFSFYDPDDGVIKIRQDIFDKPERFEVAFLVALGQSLLGNYAAKKEMLQLDEESENLGKIFQLTVRDQSSWNCYFTAQELDIYLRLARMIRSAKNPSLYTRLVNGYEGFTPPGLLFGLTYGWYLDNRFAAHIEYKMAIKHTEISDLIPEQVRVYDRRQAIIDFFREVVFRYDPSLYESGRTSSKHL
ncbi:MAG: YvcK family protein [Proteobacteria bacterium]|nr:YvcK family protein [Pseudomonadota bacterium]